jgi:hypothetical protein
MIFFRRTASYLLIFFITVQNQQAIAQLKDTLFLRFPDSSAIPEKLLKHVSKMQGKFGEAAKGNSLASRNINMSQMLQYLETDKDYHNLLLLRYWMLFHYREMIAELILRLRHKLFIGLENYDDLMILERIRAGHMKNYGHGSIERNDLFTLAGRSNWLLREITGENFGSVSMYSSAKDLTRLQERWVNWLEQLTKANE